MHRRGTNRRMSLSFSARPATPLGMKARGGLSRKPQVDSRSVQYALVIQMAQHDHKRAFLDLVLLRGLSELRPLSGAVVGNFPWIIRRGRTAVDVDQRTFFINSDDVTLPLRLFCRSLCVFLSGGSLLGSSR